MLCTTDAACDNFLLVKIRLSQFVFVIVISGISVRIKPFIELHRCKNLIPILRYTFWYLSSNNILEIHTITKFLIPFEIYWKIHCKLFENSIASFENFIVIPVFLSDNHLFKPFN